MHWCLSPHFTSFHSSALPYFPLSGNSYSDSKWIFLISRKSSNSSTIYKNQFGQNVTCTPSVSSLFFFFLSQHPLPAPPPLPVTKPKGRAQLTLPVTALTTCWSTHTHTQTHTRRVVFPSLQKTLGGITIFWRLNPN